MSARSRAHSTYPADAPIPVEVEQRVFVEVFGLDNLDGPEFSI
jgi:hypothetical protein